MQAWQARQGAAAVGLRIAGLVTTEPSSKLHFVLENRKECKSRN